MKLTSYAYKTLTSVFVRVPIKNRHGWKECIVETARSQSQFLAPVLFDQPTDHVLYQASWPVWLVMRSCPVAQKVENITLSFVKQSVNTSLISDAFRACSHDHKRSIGLVTVTNPAHYATNSHIIKLIRLAPMRSTRHDADQWRIMERYFTLEGPGKWCRMSIYGNTNYREMKKGKNEGRNSGPGILCPIRENDE